MNNKNLPQNWDFFMCRIEGVPASIRTNLALIEVAPLEGLTQRLQFYIKMQNPRPDGLSSNEEYPILCDIEDAIGEKSGSYRGCISRGSKIGRVFRTLVLYPKCRGFG